MTDTPPKLKDSPGVRWIKRKDGWEARWYAQRHQIERGYKIKTFRIWVGPLSDIEMRPAILDYIHDRANSLQSEMRVWGRGGIQPVLVMDGSISALARAYQTDPDSPYRKTRYVTRQYYDRLLNKLTTKHGETLVSEIKGRTVTRWHEQWSENAKTAMGHAMVGMFRTIVNFGVTMLEDPECERLSLVLSKMRFKMAKPRGSVLTAEHAVAIRERAHEKGLHSIALAQALQFDLMLRQKDVIGEWVPIEEPGVSEVLMGEMKWLRGLRWEEIDQEMILRHMTSKRQKMIELPLTSAPMVMEELARTDRQARGPLIIDEATGLPWNANKFRRLWRETADEAGVPKTVRNMDSRAGAITEATDAGADLESIRHAATHSDIQMTQRYSRGDADKTANVLRIRAEHRNKKGT